MMHKLESFLKRIRWKAFFFENKNETSAEHTNNFGFKSMKTPPVNEHLRAFENDLYDMIKNIEFKKVDTAFQRQLSKDKKCIKQEKLY